MGKLTKEEVIEKLSQCREKGVIILGPHGRRGDKLRVYANGGDLGRIGISDTEQCEIHTRSDYIKYLEDECVKAALLELIKESKGESKNARHASEILCDDQYISYMLEATKQHGFKPKKYQDKKVKKERVIETALIAQQGKIENKNNNLLVYDMEYAITLPTRKKKNGKDAKISEPDFIVFDGEKIGIVELKYDADNMTGKNSLKEHYLDFMDFIWNGSNEYRWDIIDESIYRLECLKDAGLIDDSWNDNLVELREWYESSKDGNFDTRRIWFGFYFVEGPHKQRKNKNYKMIPCKEYVETQIQLQLKDVMTEARKNHQNTQVRYGYWTNDEEIKLILDKKIDINDAGKVELNKLDE